MTMWNIQLGQVQGRVTGAYRPNLSEFTLKPLTQDRKLRASSAGPDPLSLQSLWSGTEAGRG